jgi:glutamine synthetase type III
LVIFLKQNLNVRNCFVCRYHSENDSFQYFRETKSLPIFCKFLKKECNSNEAVNCQYFKLEQNYVQNIMTLVQQYDSLDELHRNTFYESESDD